MYQPNETVRLDVRLENETVWLNCQQMAQLFGRDIKTIGKHIANALREELAENIFRSGLSAAVVAKFATTASDGKIYQVEYYSLDMILSVGYRVKSPEGILFRRWANTVLKEYLLPKTSAESVSDLPYWTNPTFRTFSRKSDGRSLGSSAPEIGWS